MIYFIKAEYDGKPCLLNVDYVMDMFPKGDHYEAFTMDFERGAYRITKEEFDKFDRWQKEDS